MSYTSGDYDEEDSLASDYPQEMNYVNPAADLFDEGTDEKAMIVLKPIQKKIKSRDAEAYVCVDIWGLAKSGNLDAMKDYIRDENIGGAVSVVERKDGEGNTALHYAVIEDHLDIVNYLLYCNAKKDSQNKAGRTPLHFAAMLGRVEIIKRLILDPGSPRSTPDVLGFTPLHEAVRHNRLDCVELLVSELPTPPGADRNALTATRSTPLHIAAYMGHTEIVEFLIAAGADCNLRNNSKQFAMDVARTPEIKLHLALATAVTKKCCWWCCYNK